MRTKYRRSKWLFVLLALLSFNNLLLSQEKTNGDSISIIRPFRIYHLPEVKSFFSGNAILKTPDIIPALISNDKESSLFYDSLEYKASKYLVTKKLYDLIVVSGQPSISKQVSESSQKSFATYSGKRIRKITIQRLDVFGTDIRNPLSYDPGKTETFLNKTHLNTNEFVIRNNLLFSVGDTVSPLTLSDNERLLRELPFIDESRIIVIPVSDEDVDILVLTKDVYSLGANFEYKSIDKGSFSVFEKNILGLGHELRLGIEYDPDLHDSPGFDLEYNIINIRRSFVNMNLFFSDGLGKKSFGFSLDRKLVSSTTKYAGGITVRQMLTIEDLNGSPGLDTLEYNFQDYWFSRSYLINRESVTRVIVGARYTLNNVYDHPFILPNSYHNLQKYKMFLGSVSFSTQKYYKTNLIYGYGRTEDIPYGGLLNFTAGKEINESKNRIYMGINVSTGHSIRPLGYFYTSAGISTFLNGNYSEQGMLMLRASFFSNLLYLGSFRMRNFIEVDYTRGFDRNPDEYLVYNRDNGFSGFRNDSVSGTQRLSLSLESVLFSPVNIYDFRFAFFAFGDISYLFGTNEFVWQGEALSSIGIGIRIRNDNLVFNTLQIRFGFYPNLPQYSKVNYFTGSGEQLLKPDNFDPGPPAILPYR